MEREKKEKIGSGIKGILKDAIIAGIIVVIIMGSLFAYTQRWPPMVVVESGSMQHGPSSSLGIIDTGDLVLVKKTTEREDIVAWVEGKKTDHRTYGDYGDVIIYRPFGDTSRTPIIHRAVVYIEVNATTGNTFDVPSMGIHDFRGRLAIPDYGHNNLTLYVDIDALNLNSGFLTLGDNNNGQIDQMSGIMRFTPVKVEWVVGKARGEIPWFGLIKLVFDGNFEFNDRSAPANSWTNLKISLVLLIGVPLGLDVLITVIEKRSEKREKEDEGSRGNGRKGRNGKKEVEGDSGKGRNGKEESGGDSENDRNGKEESGGKGGNGKEEKVHEENDGNGKEKAGGRED